MAGLGQLEGRRWCHFQHDARPTDVDATAAAAAASAAAAAAVVVVLIVVDVVVVLTRLDHHPGRRAAAAAAHQLQSERTPCSGKEKKLFFKFLLLCFEVIVVPHSPIAECYIQLWLI